MSVKNWVTGFARIGEQRELKKVLEKYWKGETSFDEVIEVSDMLKSRHWNYQKVAGIEAIGINDFSLYDQTLDMIEMLGLTPDRFKDIGDKTARYFAMARGDKEHTAMEMTKWFNTNYHYIVPELRSGMDYSIDISKIISEFQAAKVEGFTPKINIIGPLTFLGNAKRVDSNDLDAIGLYNEILPAYTALFEELAKLDDHMRIQIDEPILVTDKATELLLLVKDAYIKLANAADNLELYVVTYFDHAKEAVAQLLQTPIKGIGLDFVHGTDNFEVLDQIAESGKRLIAGVVDGRNIWISDIEKKVAFLNEIAQTVSKERIVVSTSCSLLHVPYTLKYEEKLDAQIKSWLAYGVEKLDELHLITKLFFEGAEALNSDEALKFAQNREANASRKSSSMIHDEAVQSRMKPIDELKKQRVAYEERIKVQHETFNYPPLATTTIGSFPQTPEVRSVRRDFKNSAIDEATYVEKMKGFIKECVEFQESIGLDILVHGEFERNDMVEYFGEQLKGVAFSQNGWVQSYGSRCVKPPIIYGDVSRPEPITVFWSTFAQSLTDRPMKGMLTGPVTILNWSFVRDDQPRAETCYQIALAIRDEVDDLQKAGIKMIQVDEAAFKEGYPLRHINRPAYEKFALESFWISTNVAEIDTQIHTHMCYSDFNDIIDTIEAMDADVISIETARSGNILLKVFKEHGYKKEVGPGVYDIHSPRVPSVEEIEKQIHSLLEVLPARQLWINPDCGLKTRRWEEVKPSLQNMVTATRNVRTSI
ncbi:5-methyltetrahydropteroyltriglutamate--homocysteine S-methyltransferase [Hydrogenimonas cancrithermarum]|uniref:5-methyltetrahydropteroyltriglutamate--homocysteine methyltransferase n=1 Tax=Hydrogenimonas cancrithermarum TaxID=2993563 RepID=A0ABM8FIS7_9BACT|nr:5-methyltetrahydropteroyltriglutamate--homocysteine S-methyltransferase [Hydrogenimonas cancrithermarum]BDY12193.1 5-methyltetrahydropteroyltriglutamate--homocysteine methyltransferase [Hydrogenimonas cancrithermarum]